jgi:hypothetical protein
MNFQEVCSKAVAENKFVFKFMEGAPEESNNIHVIACPLNGDSDNDECNPLSYGNLYLYRNNNKFEKF